MTQRSLRVLAADDDPTMALLLKTVLSAPQFQLVMVGDGQAALDAFAKPGGFDIVLLDVEMPLLDGLQVAKQLRQLEGGGLPIVLLTGREDKSFLDMRAALAAHHFSKPVDWTGLPVFLRGLVD